LTRVARGDGRLFVLGLIAFAPPLCAVLPNATVVLLLAPAVILAARQLGTDPVPAVILLVATANSAGLLTLVGDPATFLVGSAVSMSFADYLRRVSLGGLLAVLSLVPIAMIVLRGLWGVRRGSAAIVTVRLPPLRNPKFVIACLVVFGVEIFLFIVGEDVSANLSPPAVAFLGASGALLALSYFNVEPLADVLRDVDWATLLFIGLMFMMVQALVRSGALNGVAGLLFAAFGRNLGAVALLLLVAVATASALVPNVPMVASMIFVTKSYLVLTASVPEEATGRAFTDWPEATLPVFIAMMFGATLGGSATMIGAASNLVAVGILKREGVPVDFVRFARYGVPMTALQIAVAALFVFLVYPLLH
jgi:Na+/H+ antiporter NhaD/arsenite permease-like protein